VTKREAADVAASISATKKQREKHGDGNGGEERK